MRSTELKTSIRNIIGELGSQRITDDFIYNIMNDYQRRIAENFLCLENRFYLTVQNGVDSYDLLSGGAITRTAEGTGEIGGTTIITVGTTPQKFTFDTPFLETIEDTNHVYVPAYKFIVESAYVTDYTIQETVTVVEKTLTDITLVSTSDNTKVSFMIGASDAYLESSISNTTTGFYRINFIELTTGYTQDLKQVNRGMLKWLKLNGGDPKTVPTHFSVYDNSVEFWGTPDKAGTYTVHYYKVPTTTISALVNPETPERFDPIIKYGTICELAPMIGKYDLATYYENKLKEEMQGGTGKQELTKSQFNKIKDK
jgi:hypothetical protein